MVQVTSPTGSPIAIQVILTTITFFPIHERGTYTCAPEPVGITFFRIDSKPFTFISHVSVMYIMYTLYTYILTLNQWGKGTGRYYQVYHRYRPGR